MNAWRCDLCGGARQEPLSPWIVRCLDCGLACSHPLPDPAELQQRYGSDYYAGWDGAGDRLRIWRQRLKLMQPWARNGGLLDVGCGSGEFLREARKQGFEPTGTEFSDAARSAIRDFKVARDPGETAGPFDLVTLWHVLEHVPSPRQTLQVLRSKLKPSGLLFVAVPNIDSRWFNWVYRLGKGHEPELYSPQSKEPHLYHFSQQTLRRLLETSGFHILKEMPDVPDANFLYRMADLPARVLYALTGKNWTLTLFAACRRAD